MLSVAARHSRKNERLGINNNWAKEQAWAGSQGLANIWYFAYEGEADTCP